MKISVKNIKVVIAWVIVVILLTIIFIQLARTKSDHEGFTGDSEDSSGDRERSKILGAISYLDKPDHVYLVDMDGAHDYIYEDDALKPTGETKYLGSIIPIEKLADIDTVAVSPISGEFMHLAFSNSKQEIYHYSPSEQKIENVWSYKSQFGDKITNVVAAWQSNVTRPNHDKLFIFDGTSLWLLAIDNKFAYSDDKATKDPRLSFLSDMYAGDENEKPRAIASIWPITPRVDTFANIAVFNNSDYFIHSIIKQKSGKVRELVLPAIY